ncbi:MAG: hypothetical protein ACK559_36090, partial [bacterium]
ITPSPHPFITLSLQSPNSPNIVVADVLIAAEAEAADVGDLAQREALGLPVRAGVVGVGIGGQADRGVGRA